MEPTLTKDLEVKQDAFQQWWLRKILPTPYTAHKFIHSEQLYSACSRGLPRDELINTDTCISMHDAHSGTEDDSDNKALAF